MLLSLVVYLLCSSQIGIFLILIAPLYYNLATSQLNRVYYVIYIFLFCFPELSCYEGSCCLCFIAIPQYCNPVDRRVMLCQSVGLHCVLMHFQETRLV